MVDSSLKKILLAEDDRSLSRSLDTWLTLEGFEVVTVYNGEEALNKLLKEPYDLLITDIAMPRLNGVDLITEVRNVTPRLPIMVVSGKLNPDLINELRDMQVEHMLPKPIKPMEFRKVIGSFFPDYMLS